MTIRYEDLELNIKVPARYKKIKVYLVFDAKHDGRYKARHITSSHLTNVPLSSIYFYVVSLRGTYLVLFLAELNSLYS